jgi:hypothetical protein
MSQTILIELQTGRKVLFGGDDAPIGRELTSSKTVGAVAGKLGEALDALGDVVAEIEARIGKLARKPGKIDVEFGVSLTSKGDLWIVSGEGKAELKVKLSWENKPESKS